MSNFQILEGRILFIMGL